jgi:hypothetical protein
MSSGCTALTLSAGALPCASIPTFPSSPPSCGRQQSSDLAYRVYLPPPPHPLPTICDDLAHYPACAVALEPIHRAPPYCQGGGHVITNLFRVPVCHGQHRCIRPGRVGRQSAARIARCASPCVRRGEGGAVRHLVSPRHLMSLAPKRIASRAVQREHGSLNRFKGLQPPCGTTRSTCRVACEVAD